MTTSRNAEKIRVVGSPTERSDGMDREKLGAMLSSVEKKTMVRVMARLLSETAAKTFVKKALQEELRGALADVERADQSLKDLDARRAAGEEEPLKTELRIRKALESAQSKAKRVQRMLDGLTGGAEGHE